MKNRIMMCTGGIILSALLVAGFLAYFVVSQDPETQQFLDGWGRPLVESPLFMRLLFTDRLWAGWHWFFADGAISVFGLMIGCFLTYFGWRRAGA